MAATRIDISGGNFDVKGVKDLQRMFNMLPKQIDNPKTWIKIFRLNSKPMVQSAKSHATFKKGFSTGQVRESIGFFTTKASRKVGGGYVGPRVRGAYRSKEKTGFYGAFVEYGDQVMFGGKATSVAQKFMKPAYDNTKAPIMASLLRAGKKVLKREVKRLRKFGTLGY